MEESRRFPETLDNLTKTAKQISAIEKVKAIADELKTKRLRKLNLQNKLLKTFSREKMKISTSHLWASDIVAYAADPINFDEVVKVNALASEIVAGSLLDKTTLTRK